MVVKKLSVREVRANLADLLNLVYYTKEPVVVERKGKAVAVMVSPEQYERMRKDDDDRWAVVEGVQELNKDEDPDEVYREVAAVVEEVRQEIYDKEQAGRRRR